MPMTGKSFKKKKTWVMSWCWGWTNERTLVKDMYHTVSGFCAHWVLRSKTGDDCDYNVSLGRILRSSSWSFLRALHASTGRRGHRCTSQVFWSHARRDSFILQRCGQNPIGCQKGPPVLQSCRCCAFASQRGLHSEEVIHWQPWLSILAQQNMLGS